MAAVSISNNHPSPLLKLPGEIRNQIYSHAIVEDRPISLFLGDARTPNWSPPDHQCITNRSVSPALAKVCRKLRHEVISTYFAEKFLLPYQPAL